MTATLQARIERLSIPEPNSGCWLWLGRVDRRGYGRASFRSKATLAHRLSYTAFRGQIADGLFVCHSCDLPCCVNPTHLWLGTCADNNRDMFRKGRARSFGLQVTTDDTIIGATYLARQQRWQAQYCSKYLGLFVRREDATAAYWRARNAAA